MTPKQMSLSMQHDAGFEQYRKATRRDVFLTKMDQVMPWAALCAVIAPHYPGVSCFLCVRRFCFCADRAVVRAVPA